MLAYSPPVVCIYICGGTQFCSNVANIMTGSGRFYVSHTYGLYRDKLGRSVDAELACMHRHLQNNWYLKQTLSVVTRRLRHYRN
jgi:hypothetical protein